MAVSDRLSLFCRDRMTVGSYYNIRVIYYERGFMNKIPHGYEYSKEGVFRVYGIIENIIYLECWIWLSLQICVVYPKNVSATNFFLCYIW